MAIRKEKYGDLQKSAGVVKKSSEELKSRKEVFRGFIPGTSIRTEKGYVGSRLDSLWARNVLESLVNDDAELLNIALESSIAEVSCVVEGGEYASPYCLDNYGFYAANQFVKQHEALKEHERALVAEKAALFLSDREWDYVDAQLGRYAKFNKARLKHVERGDSIPMLAMREAAFEVCAASIRKGADPLVYNEKQEDLIDILKVIYAELNESIRLNFRKQKEMTRTVMLPLEVASVLKSQDQLKGKLDDMATFLEFIIGNLNERIKAIEEDKWTMRKMTLRKEVVPFELRWNVEQEDRAHALCKEAEQYLDFLKEKFIRHKETVDELDLRGLLEKQQAFVAPENLDKCDIKDLETVLRPPSPSAKKKVGKVSRRERVRKLQISYVYNEEGEKVYDYSALPVDESTYAPTRYAKKSENANEVIEYR